MGENNRNMKQLQFWLLVGMFGILYLMWLGWIILDNPEPQHAVFFLKGDNYLADLFNVMIYARDRAPYISTVNSMAEKAYFPLSYLICYVLSAVTGMDYYAVTYGDTYNGTVQSLRSMPIVLGVFFIILLLMILAVQIYEFIDAEKWMKWILTFVMMGSGAMMFTYERGNLILLALIGVLLFLATYDSETKWLRELGYIGLAVAGALKGYPAILGLLLVFRHEWKSVIRLVIYGVVMAFGPFLLLKGGLSNIPIWLDNLRQNSEEYRFLEQPRLGYLYVITKFPNTTIEDKLAMYQIWKPIVTLIGIYGAATAYFQTKRWLQAATLLSFILIYPDNSGWYCLIYMIPVILLYLNERDKTWSDLGYFWIFALILSPFQLIDSEYNNRTILIMNMVVFILFGLCLIQNTICLMQCIRRKTILEKG